MKILLVTACLFATLATGTAHAALISMNDATYGVGSITRDTTTGFDWLDLTESLNFSVNDILGGAGGFLANGFVLATLGEVEAMYASGGWDGVDDSANNGTAVHVPFVTLMHTLFGVTGAEADGSPFGEGWALSSVAGLVSRPFNTLTTAGAAGRVACTTVGFNLFAAPVNDFSSCRMDYDQRHAFIGAFLVRDPGPAVPEPATLILLGCGLAAAGLRRRATKRA